MKIYTRTGDAGQTSLYGGARVAKTHTRIDAYGTVDETNSFLGLAKSYLQEIPGCEAAIPLLERIQEELFVLGADLATPADARQSVTRIEPAHIERLEQDIDNLDAELPRLKHFVLPGGSIAASTLHVARTVCRRAERMSLDAAGSETLSEHVLVYLNRLSDLLFVLARWTNQQAGIDEPIWDPKRREPA